MLTVFASALGPFIFSYSKRATDSYSSIFNILADLVFVMAAVAWITPVPRFGEHKKGHSQNNSAVSL